MKITKDDVLHVAELARLKFEEDEIELFTEQLGNILGYIEKLSELDTDGVDATSQVLEITTPLREDEVKNCLTVDEVLKNAPETQDNFFVVPKVIED